MTTAAVRPTEENTRFGRVLLCGGEDGVFIISRSTGRAGVWCGLDRAAVTQPVLLSKTDEIFLSCFVFLNTGLLGLLFLRPRGVPASAERLCHSREPG